MGCDVCITSDYDGMAECTACHHPKARKPVRCCECGQTINKGETYERYSGKWEGDWFVTRTCQICAEIRDTFYCNGWTSETLWEDMHEVVF